VSLPTTALLAGVHRGLAEFRHQLTDRSELSANVFFGLIPLAFLLWFHLAGDPVVIADREFPVARFVAPGMYALVVSFSLLGPLYTLADERQNGTLLRVRTMPHGLVSYSVGKTVTAVCEAFFGVALVVVPASVFIDGLTDVPAAGWLAFLGFLLLGILAILPLGVALGSLLRSPKGVFSFGLAGIGAVTWASGLIQPLIEFPRWVQQIAQVLPFHWLGHGLRHALLPDHLAGVELGGVWRPGTAVAVLITWSVAGLALAPLSLRRTARHESGSRVEARREQAMQAAP
jgi:ABC-2 type transport system permease protein